LAYRFQVKFSNSSSICLRASCSGTPWLMRTSVFGRCRFLDSSDLSNCSSPTATPGQSAALVLVQQALDAMVPCTISCLLYIIRSAAGYFTPVTSSWEAGQPCGCRQTANAPALRPSLQKRRSSSLLEIRMSLKVGLGCTDAYNIRVRVYTGVHTCPR